MNRTHFLDYPDTFIWIFCVASGHFPNYLEILQPIMSMLQKLSGFAKTFRSALLTRWQGFSDSVVTINHIKYQVRLVDVFHLFHIPHVLLSSIAGFYNLWTWSPGNWINIAQDGLIFQKDDINVFLLLGWRSIWANLKTGNLSTYNVFLLAMQLKNQLLISAKL